MASKALLQNLFQSALAAVSADLRLPPHLPSLPRGRTLVVGAGKGAGAMAVAVEKNWHAPLSGLVVTRYGHSLPTERIEIIEAAHPVPDAKGIAAAERILQLAQNLTADDLLLCLISGGGSALLALPAPGLTLDDKRNVTRDLLRCGATIHEINCLRKHLSAIKGGRLAAAAHPAQVVSLIISDVPGDDPAVIASGPTVADPSTFADARAIIAKYGLNPSPAVIQHLSEAKEESLKPHDPRLKKTKATVIARPRDALYAAAHAARMAGYEVELLGDALEGEARDLGRTHAELASKIQKTSRRTCILSGGETTVTVKGQGRGGRNAEYLLGLTIALDGAPGISALAADTDGIDGSEDNAGAFAFPDSLDRARAAQIDPQARLMNNDAYGFFADLGDLLVTGPTRTNVNDFRAILVE